MPWSLSQYNLYRKCPTAYKFRIVDRVPDPAGPAAARGTDIHAQLEAFLATGEWSGNIRAFTKLKAEKMRSEMYNAEVKIALNDQWLPVDWRSPDAWVRGVIDAWSFSKDQIKMGEWKTGKAYDDHVNQRRLYLVLSLCAFPEADKAYIETIYADQDHAQADELSRKDLPEQQTYWKEAVKPMLQDTFFSPRPGGHCRWCAFSKEKGGPCAVA